MLKGVPGHDIERFPTVRRLSRNRCIEYDQVELVLVFDWYARRCEQSELVNEDKLGSEVAEKTIIYAVPLEDLQRWRASR